MEATKLIEKLWIGGVTTKTSAGNVTVVNEGIVIVKKSSGAATQVTLTPTPTTGMCVMVVDGKGDAATNNITVVAASGNINGAANYVISENYGAAVFCYGSSEWNILATYAALSATELGFLNGVTAGTVTASKAVVVDANLQVDRLGVVDAGEVFVGTGDDAGLQWSTGDASNHSTVLFLGDTNQALHVTDKAARDTDWNVSADTHPTLYVHSNTTPATDYVRFGGHDGTNAFLDMVGGTGFDIKIDGIGVLRIDDATVGSFAGAADTAGKDVFLEAQAGGTASADTSGVAGADITITAGDGSAGGAHTMNDPDGGAGGVITLAAGAGGAAGSGGSGVAGAPGKVKVSSGLLHFTNAQSIDMADAAVALTLVPGTPTGTLLTSNVLFVDPNSMQATENLDLPPEADCNGLVLHIMNTGGEGIVVRDDGGGTIITLDTDQHGLVACNGTAWRGFMGGIT